MSKLLVRVVITVIVCTAAMLVQVVPVPGLVTVVAVLPLLGFIPGYAVMGALFPASSSLRTSLRAALAVLLSLCIVPAIATVLDSTPYGIRPLPLILSLMALSLVAALVEWMREQWILRQDQVPVRDRQMPAGKCLWNSGGGQWVSGALFLAVVATVLYWTLLAPPVAQPFTEFYTEPEMALILSQPGQGFIEGAAMFPLTVVNHENRECVYSVEMVVDGVPKWVAGPARVGDGERWQTTVPMPGEVNTEQRVELRLYREGDRAPYRTLHLWIGHEEPQETGLLPQGMGPLWESDRW